SSRGYQTLDRNPRRTPQGRLLRAHDVAQFLPCGVAQDWPPTPSLRPRRIGLASERGGVLTSVPSRYGREIFTEHTFQPPGEYSSVWAIPGSAAGPARLKRSQETWPEFPSQGKANTWHRQCPSVSNGETGFVLD